MGNTRLDKISGKIRVRAIEGEREREKEETK
jgi:hypothetical protein